MALRPRTRRGFYARLMLCLASMLLYTQGSNCLTDLPKKVCSASLTRHQRIVTLSKRAAPVPKECRRTGQPPEEADGKAKRANQDADSFRRATQIMQEDLKERFAHSDSSKADRQRGQRVYNRHDRKHFA